MDLPATIALAEQIVAGVVKIAPIVESGVVTAEPYVQAIVELVKSGGDPTSDAWAAVNARLDVGSAILDQRAADAADLTKT